MKIGKYKVWLKAWYSLCSWALPLWVDATIYPGEYHDITVSILCFNAEISWMLEAKANRSLDDVFKELNDGAD